MSDEEDVEVNVVSEAEDSSDDGKKFGDIVGKTPKRTGFAEAKRDIADRRPEEWLELRGIDLDRWRKLSRKTKSIGARACPPSPGDGERYGPVKRMQESLGRTRSPTDSPAEDSALKSPGSGGKSPERRSFRCSKSRSRSPSPKSPASTPNNPIYTSFSISSILSRTDSSTKRNSFSGNVQQNLVLDAATNFLSHHPACTDPTMLSRYVSLYFFRCKINSNPFRKKKSLKP